MNKNTKKLILKTQKQIHSYHLGNHASKFHGEGFEFSELREYVYGDDVRKIDWKTTSKTRTPYVKVYHEERELNVVVATMMSGSMAFGTCRLKKDVAQEIVALLGYATLAQSDRLSLFLFADKLLSMSKPSKQRFALIRELEVIEQQNIIGKASNYKVMCDTLYNGVVHKSLIYIITDGIGEFDFARIAKKHEVVLVVVRDRFEEHPKELGFVGLVDLENRQRYMGNIDSIKLAHYTKALRENDLKLYEHTRKYGIKMVKIYTDENPFLKLIQGL